MARKLFGFNETTTIILTIIFTFSAFGTKAIHPSGPFDYYKVSFQWPISRCNGHWIACERPYLEYFTIHGLWPMYYPDIDVPPYPRSECNRFTPMQPDEVNSTLLAPILDDMKYFWPDVTAYSDNNSNEIFWNSQWRNHGMCYGRDNLPVLPLEFFSVALDTRKGIDIQNILNLEGIVPLNRMTYEVKEIADAIAKELRGVRPQIRCNNDYRRVKQLYEVWICFDTADKLMSCPVPFSNCEEHDSIRWNIRYRS